MKQMRDSCAKSALSGNGMYLSTQVGQIAAEDSNIGPDEVIKFHEIRARAVDNIVTMFLGDQDGPYAQPISVFDEPATLPNWRAGLKDFEVDIVDCLLASKLEHGFIVELLKDQSGYFRDWIRIDLDVDAEGEIPKSEWFSKLLKWTRWPSGRKQIDACFRRVMAEFLHLIIRAIKNRRNNRHSFELQAYQFLSGEFDNIIHDMLPLWIYNNQPNCYILGMCLKKLALGLLKDAIVESKKKRKPDLFKSKGTGKLSDDEEKCEVCRHFGWAIFSAKKRAKGDEDALTVLNSLTVHLDELDKDYFANYYSTGVSILNSGGLTLPVGWIFEFGLTLMAKARAEFNREKMDRDPKNAFRIAKEKMLADAELKALFRKQCTAMVPIESTARLSASIEKVYRIVLPKVLHSRYGQIVKDWSKDNVKSSEKSTLRDPLKASEASKKRKARTETDKKAPRPPIAPKVTPEIAAECPTLPEDDKLLENSVAQPQSHLHIDFDNLPPAKRMKTNEHNVLNL